MKKLTSLVLALVASMCSLTSWAAERALPAVPANAAPVSGQTYYLYNVETRLFLSSYNTIGESALDVLVTVNDDGAFLLKNGASANYIGKSNNGSMWIWSSATDKNNYWSVAESDGSYTIQCSPLNTGYYVEGQFVGTQEGNTTVRYDRTSGDQVHWLFIRANDAGVRFVAEMKLYRALCALDELVLPKAVTAHYESLYANRAKQTADVLTTAALEVRNCTGMTQGYKAPYWNEYPILWATSEGTFGQNYRYTWELYSSGGGFHTEMGSTSRTLSATVAVGELSTFVYTTSGPSDTENKIQVYVDDKLVRTLVSYQMTGRFFEVLQPGTHTIKWVASSTDVYARSFYVTNSGVVKSPLIIVSLLEPGSLGTEVLYNTDHIKNVRRLKVKGKMNDDDWTKVKMMSGLLDLDLSEAEFTEVPEGQFRYGSGDTAMQFLHRLVLPEGVTKINRYAFYGSLIDTLALPSTLRNIREQAFYQSHIQEIDMPDDCTEIEGHETSSGAHAEVFYRMYWLRKLKCAKNWTMIPYYTFGYCYFLEEVTLPEKLEAIGVYAFDGCNNAVFSPFPESLQRIRVGAFVACNKIVNLFIPKNVSTIEDGAFADCKGLETAELCGRLYYISNYMFGGCTSLKTLRLNSPTVVTVTDQSSNYPVDANRLKDVDLIVPSFIVNGYRQHKYWYNFKSITGFNTAEVKDWVINDSLVLNHERIEGNPNITINGDYDRMPSLKFNGTSAQTIDNLTISGQYYNYRNYPGQIFSNCNAIQVKGDVQVNLYTPAKTWKFFSLPFDVKVADITHSADDVQYKIGYYDGANRATYGATGSWKTFDKENDVIPAGTGFIMQTNKDTWNYFHAVNNAAKQNIVSNRELVKTLEVHPSEQKADIGWNLVGNPWQCFYNSHCLNFTAPITVWNESDRKYEAYSITDDDYAIRPCEAFFVQCPGEEYSTIGFPVQGRQFSDVISSQNAVRALQPEQKERRLVNVVLTAADKSNDETRVVLNEKASLDYETACDASKFQSMDSSVPQLFTLDAEGTHYAINERPLADGLVKLGLSVARGGTYTIGLGRCDMEKVMLIDNETGETTDISYGEYTFSTKAGTFMNRFELAFDAEDEATGVQNPGSIKADDDAIYNMAGQRVGSLGMRGIYIIGGKKVVK
ncbi:MAG: leucine-rich repeat domain-containing protein [Bacteroidaceae bacterium]|nr:leucine-rich repeat domain-containing protein [Bacteroidaceae bacterium]